MSKEITQKQNIEEAVMIKVKTGQIKMKPKWYFIVGGVAAIAGLISSIVSSVFFVNLIIFIIRKKGPGVGKLTTMFDIFPWWIPFVAITGIVAGLLLLRRYDFSYKKNFVLTILGFIVAVLVSALILDGLGINDILMKNGSMRGFYQNYSGQGTLQNHQPQQGRRGKN